MEKCNKVNTSEYQNYFSFTFKLNEKKKDVKKYDLEREVTRKGWRKNRGGCDPQRNYGDRDEQNWKSKFKLIPH